MTKSEISFTVPLVPPRNSDIMGESEQCFNTVPTHSNDLDWRSSVPDSTLPSDGLCLCGCGQKTVIARQTDKRAGHVKGQPQHYILGHQTRLKQPYVLDPATGCWNWAGYIDESGYGRAGYARSKSKQAHLVYYEKHVGAIPNGLELDHTCKNTKCVNPAHLEPVTHAENVRRAAPKLTHAKAEQVRQRFAFGSSLKQVMAEFGISKSHAYRMREGQSWKK